MKDLFVAARETGEFIEAVQTVDEGIELIRRFEEEDKADGTYTQDFYDIVDEDHMHVEW